VTLLRPYQIQAVDAVFEAWSSGIKRPAVVQATGTGKTIVLSSIISQMVRAEKRRPLVLAHREELLSQTADKLRAVDPYLSVGILQAGRHEVDADVVVASVQSISRRLGVGSRAVNPSRFDLVIVDEAHHASAKTYLSTLEHFGAMDPASETLALGVTATLARSDNIPLGHVWDEVVFEYSAHDAITDGYLVRPLAQRVELDGVSLKGVKTIAGDFSESDLGKRMYRSGQQIAKAILEHGLDSGGRVRRGITFAPTIECAHQWAADFNAAGIRSTVIIGATSTVERQAAYRALTGHHIDMLVSVMVLTEGFDLPAVEMCVQGRPTRSMPLYVQMIGRVLRPSPTTGKVDALILDLCGTITDKLTTLVDLDIPDVCVCGCDCGYEHLCVLRCACPRARSGKLKRPCIVCLKKGTNVRSCTHYENRHVIGCQHHCDGIGKPGLFEEDPVDEVVLDAAGNPIEWGVDDSEVRLRQVDLFDSSGTRIKKRARRSGWQLTKKEIPFLTIGTGSEQEWVFLWKDAEIWPGRSAWTVGRKPKVGKASRVSTHEVFAEAVKAAEALDPRHGKPRPALSGPATENQLATLRRFGYDTPEGMTKEQASQALNQCFASKGLDPA
jgi:superfamily II DNA or RNA helicase